MSTEDLISDHTATPNTLKREEKEEKEKEKEKENLEEKAMVRSAPDGSDNHHCSAKSTKVVVFIF